MGYDPGLTLERDAVGSWPRNGEGGGAGTGDRGQGGRITRA